MELITPRELLGVSILVVAYHAVHAHCALLANTSNSF